MTDRLAILAPTYRAACVEADERWLRPSQWFYVEHEIHVRGYPPGRYALRLWHPDGRLSDEQIRAINYMERSGWRRRIASER